jgi:hypothetical protein
VLGGDHDNEIEYHKWYHFTAGAACDEGNETESLSEDIWPHWADGVPSKLRRELGSPAFKAGNVQYRYRTYYETLNFVWNEAYRLSELRKHKGLLPRHSSGIYRLFAPDMSIARCCGTDPTGTLYLGCAGTKRNWSNLRTRVKNIVQKDHHAMINISGCEVAQKTFPWETLAVEWAYMGKRLNYSGKSEPAAVLGETWLLASYHDSFGELPPWNQRG